MCHTKCSFCVWAGVSVVTRSFLIYLKDFSINAFSAGRKRSPCCHFMLPFLGFHWVSWICNLIFFIRFGKVLVTISSDFLFDPIPIYVSICISLSSRTPASPTLDHWISSPQVTKLGSLFSGIKLGSGLLPWCQVYWSFCLSPAAEPAQWIFNFRNYMYFSSEIPSGSLFTKVLFPILSMFKSLPMFLVALL